MKTLLFVVGFVASGFFQAAGTQQSRNYSNYLLVQDAVIIDECLICGRPTIPVPIRGGFVMERQEDPNLFVFTGIRFTNQDYTITGTGYVNFSPDRSQQEVQLQLQVDRGWTNETLLFRTSAKETQRKFPMVDLTAVEQPGSMVRTYTIRIAAAPIQEILFSTTSDFTSGPSFIARTAGDALRYSGDVFAARDELHDEIFPFDFSIHPGTDALDLDDVGRLTSSLSAGDPSLNLEHGTLVNLDGDVILTETTIRDAFGIAENAGPIGLDASHKRGPGRHWISIAADNVHSGKLGTQLFRGDVLSSDGKILKRGEELVAAFQPQELRSYGLDALFVWNATGEIWFSTEESFNSIVGQVSDGDLLSDAGYIVFRNLELMQAQLPNEDKLNFGLDSLHIISDFASSLNVINAPRLTAVLSGGRVALAWTGNGLAFQVEKASEAGGPYRPASPLLRERSWVEPEPLSAAAFYRVYQW